MKTSLDQKRLPSDVTDRLRAANLAFLEAYPGESHKRQPAHVVYGGAHLFHHDVAAKMRELSVAALHEHGHDAVTLARALGYGEDIADKVWHCVERKLNAEPLEDFRIDFEDGYGVRPDSEEDGHAAAVAAELASGLEKGALPPFIGIRIKPLSEELRGRSLRTLDIVVSTTVALAKRLPDNFVVTLPKITVPEQIELLAAALDELEAQNGLKKGSIPIELMVETTQSILAPTGEASLPKFIALGQGRITGAHFGTYDYTAACNITAAHQHMAHPECVFAKHVMKVTLAGTGVFLSDGATNVMPVGPHRGDQLNDEQRRENDVVVHRAWKLSYDHIRYSLKTGFYQGWDLHPAQLPVRYAAIFAFFFEGIDSAGARLRAFLDKAAQATLLGDVFDDAATGQGLLNYFLRATSAGAITEQEAEAMSGIRTEELRTRSFVKILAGRKKK